MTNCENYFVIAYEYIEDPPQITNETPTGVINNSRPTISAVIHYPFINSDLIEMKVDGNKITPSFERIDSHNAKINFTPSYDLSMGRHTVYVSGKSYYSQAEPGEKECAPPVEKEWTFEIMKCANIAGSWNFSEEGSMTCTIDGETQTQIISGAVEIMIEQNDCNIRYEIPVPDELGGGYIERTGKIDGNNIDISGIYVIPLGEANITQNIATMHGTISGDEINLSGSGIARGTIDGMSFSCTGTSTAVATR